MGGMGTSADAADALAAQGPAPCLPEPTGPGIQAYDFTFG
jgi:hypothetical protein